MTPSLVIPVRAFLVFTSSGVAHCVQDTNVHLQLQGKTSGRMFFMHVDNPHILPVH
jgi:hypothetical protein